MTIAERSFWFKLGLILYDNGDKRDGLAAFKRTAALEKTVVYSFEARLVAPFVRQPLRRPGRRGRCGRR